MIRFSRETDIPDLIGLWQEAFGDDEEWISDFLDGFYIPDNTLVDEQNGEIAATLYLIEGDMLIGDKAYPSYYLYAACTGEKFRGRGIMTRLLDFAAREAESRGRYFICLRPGEKSLFDFYGERGYIKAFGKRHITVKRSDGESTLCPDEYQNPSVMRNKAFCNCDYFALGGDGVDKAIELSVKGGARLFKCCKGYALYTVNSTKCTVNEFAFTDECIADFAKYIFANHQCDIVTFSLVCNRSDTLNGEDNFDYDAMALPLNGEASKAISDVKNAYLGLTLE